MLRPSSLVRESMTRESGWRQNGQCMAGTDYRPGRRKRAVTASLLIKLTETLDVDLAALSGSAERQLESGLREVLSDPMLGLETVPEEEVATLAASAPNAARSWGNLPCARSPPFHERLSQLRPAIRRIRSKCPTLRTGLIRAHCTSCRGLTKNGSFRSAAQEGLEHH